jgi:hypothetical protein
MIVFQKYADIPWELAQRINGLSLFQEKYFKEVSSLLESKEYI